MKSGHTLIKVLGIIGLLVMVVGFYGCSVLGTDKSPQGSGTVSKSRQTTAVYLDFEDILIPNEMQVIEKQTVVVRSPGFVSGILALKGRVDRTSLFTFFNNNMQKDNWKMISQIKSPGTSILVFQKAARTAVITIRDSEFITWVEIGVAPTVNSAEPAMEGFINDDDFSETTIED